MPPGVLGFVFTFPNGRVMRTNARRLSVRGATQLTLSDGDYPIRNLVDADFYQVGRVVVGNGGEMIFPNGHSVPAPNGCEITAPIGG